jgi:hypothetical protein
VLASIPDQEYKRLHAHLEPIDLNFGEVLYEPATESRRLTLATAPSTLRFTRLKWLSFMQRSQRAGHGRSRARGSLAKLGFGNFQRGLKIPSAATTYTEASTGAIPCPAAAPPLRATL